MGARDSLSAAKEFVETAGGKTLTMLWDETGRSWLDLQVRSQPYFIVVSREGKIIDRTTHWDAAHIKQKLSV